jgi:hypothetical protein
MCGGPADPIIVGGAPAGDPIHTGEALTGDIVAGDGTDGDGTDGDGTDGDCADSLVAGCRIEKIHQGRAQARSWTVVRGLCRD